MDMITKDAIRLLREDARRSFSDIARRLGVNRTSIANRLSPLLADGSLQVVSTLHPRLLGLEYLAHVRISHRQMPNDLCRFLDELREVVFVSEVTGAAQLVAEIHVESLSRLNDLVLQIRGRPTVLEVEVLLYEEVLSSPFMGAEPQLDRRDLDAVDFRLIELLQADGRMSFSDLATSLNFSVASTRDRVLRLMKMNVIYIGVVQGSSSGNFDFTCGVGVNLSQRSAAVERLFTSRPGLGFLGRTLGRFDLAATVAFSSTEELHMFTNQLRDNESVLSVESWLHIHTHVERYLHSSGLPTE